MYSEEFYVGKPQAAYNITVFCTGAQSIGNGAGTLDMTQPTMSLAGHVSKLL